MLAVAALGADKKLTTLKIIDQRFDAKNAAPGEIFSKINIDPSSKLIFAQNKFDLPEPSLVEIRFAKNLKEAAELMGLQFIDYLSIAEYDNYLSFKENKYIKF
jgi:DNA repair protein RadC